MSIVGSTLHGTLEWSLFATRPVSHLGNLRNERCLKKPQTHQANGPIVRGRSKIPNQLSERDISTVNRCRTLSAFSAKQIGSHALQTKGPEGPFDSMCYVLTAKARARRTACSPEPVHYCQRNPELEPASNKCLVAGSGRRLRDPHWSRCSTHLCCLTPNSASHT
jgi:hypothetical protein